MPQQPGDDEQDPPIDLTATRHISVTQHVYSTGGHSLQVGVGNIHVFSDLVPVYWLEGWRRPRDPGTTFFRAVASRMLNARYAVVGFTGRSSELQQLREWRDGEPRLSVRWLHGEGGQGKSRLSAELAAESSAAGWKVLTAVQGPHMRPPEEATDLRLDGCAGVLLLVDYANEWPSSHLKHLLNDTVLRQVGVRTRVVLLARSHGDWQGIESQVEELGGAFSVQRLGPLAQGPAAGAPDPRQEMFVAARTAFAAKYELADAHTLEPPSDLGLPEFGLTLAVHMAALVAVDAAARGASAPRGAAMADLTRYLLRREYKHWEQQYGDPVHELNPQQRTYFTPAPVMNRVVFTAALTGPADRRQAAAVLAKQALPLAAPQLLDDHAVCYPSAEPGLETFLEPLYPDRLTEDFLALTLTGDGVAYPEYAWAAKAAVDVLLPLDGTDAGDAPAWTARALVFLAAAASRWPGVGPKVLYPWAVLQPRRFLSGGSAALSALAAIGRDGDRATPLTPELFAALASVHQALPAGRHTDLDSGAAEVTDRLAGHHLAGRLSDEDRVEWLCDSGIRLGHAGRPALAAERFAQAVPIARARAGRLRPERRASLAFVLCHLGSALHEAGGGEAAVAPLAESVRLYRELAAAKPAQYLADLAMASSNLSGVLNRLGRNVQALAAADEAASSLRALPAVAAGAHRALLAAALGNRSVIEFEAGHPAASLASAGQAAAILRELAAENPAEHLPWLAAALNGLGNAFERIGRQHEALAPTREAEELLRSLAAQNPTAYRALWAISLSNLGLRLANLGEAAEALGLFEDAVAAGRRLAEANPAAYTADLARYLTNLGTCLQQLGRRDRAHAALDGAVEMYERLFAHAPAAHLSQLAGALNNLGALELKMGRACQSVQTQTRSADLLRGLRAENPGAHQQLFVLALHNLADALAASGKTEQAEAVAREALKAGPDPRDADAAARLPGSAMALLSLAETLSKRGRDREAAEASGRAVEILRGLARDNQGHAPHLAAALHNHGIHLACIDETDKALAVLRESVELCAILAKANPAAHAEELGVGLYVLGCVLVQTGDRDAVTEAVAVLEQAAKVFGQAAGLRTTSAPLRCAFKLNEVCDELLELNQLPKALALAESTAEQFRALASADPDRYRASLGLVLSRLCLRTYNDSRMADAKAVGMEALAILRALTEAQRAEGEEELREAERRIVALGDFDNPWAR
ncbi:tetratricopeptide repeat protein [Actinospica robiniae]|uniref:tetratricopeptide repeat protein n=1 Tax=Actinospica robiniae TaxID=304901 RepID=UPI000425B4D0|nr:tetratricopeptide repeat protein [Actinospica robiniae]